MNPINFTLGAIRLPSLFTTCLDIIEKIDDYKHFNADERALATQFASHRLRFKKWGKSLGLDQEAAELCEEQHEALADSETLQTVRQIINIAQEILSDRQGKPAHSPGTLNNAKTGPPSSENLAELSRTAPASRRARLMWVLKGKGRREDQVELLGNLIQHLYHLVPLEASPQSTTDLAIRNDLHQIANNASWASEIRPTIKRLEAEAEAEARRELHAWLVRYPSNEIFEEAIQRRLCDTCSWILERPIFEEWLSLQEDRVKPKLLWINGPAGFGKTILCAKIVEHLSAAVETPVAHFFFSSDFESCNDPCEAVRYWISNVMFHNNTVFDYIRAEREKQLEPVAARALVMQLFQKIVHLLPGCIFIIDGLDECTWLNRSITGVGDSVTSFLEKLDDAVAESATRIMIVSRDESAIRTGIESMERIQISEHKIRPDDVSNDTQKYSRSIVEKKLSQKAEMLKKEISQKMAEQCAGQFLWLKLQGDLLRGGKNSKQLQALINKTPSGLESLYRRNWDRLSGLPEDDRNRAFTLLRLTTFAAKPLTVTELAEASIINVDSDEYPLDDLPDAIDGEYINSEILGLCGSLLSIHQNSVDLGSSTVRLTHFSIKQYYLYHDPNSGNVLIQNEILRRSNEMKENTAVAKVCLRYIQYKETWRIEGSHDSIRIQGSFRNYAADFWYRHFLEGYQEDELMNKLTDGLFDSHDSVKWKQWRETYDSIDERKTKLYGPSKFEDENSKQECLTSFTPPTPVFYASKINLTKLTLRLIKKHQDHLDDMSYFGETALCNACLNGNETVSRQLITSGANINLATRNGGSPLHFAVICGHLNLVQLLLEVGAEVNAIDCYKATPLHHAAFASKNEILRLLIGNGADLEIRNGKGRTALALAASNENPEAVRILVESGANLALVDNYGFGTLHFAAFRGLVDFVRFLLVNRADCKSMSKTGCTPVYLASQGGHAEVVRLLLENGANPVVETAMGETPLSAAIRGGHIEIVDSLLKNGASPTAAIRSVIRPSTLASSLGQIQILEVLLSHGADVSTPDQNGRTPLMAASMNLKLDMIRFLLDKGADITATDNNGGIALFYALKADSAAIKLHLERGADVLATGSDGGTAMCSVAYHRHVDIIHALVESGADILATDGFGCTALYWAAMKGYVESVQFLLEKGAGLAPLDTFENSILHVASLYGQSEVIKDQLQNSSPTTINRTDLDGRTPLFDAAMRGNSEILDILLSHSADVNVRDRYNASALFAAVRNQHLEVIQRLLAVDNTVLDYQDCFGQTVFSWAYRSKNLRVIQLMEMAAAQRNFELPSHMEIQAPLEAYVFYPEASFCDICTRSIRPGVKYFGCEECIGFAICSECSATGVRCREKFHEWVSRCDIPGTHAHDDKNE